MKCLSIRRINMLTASERMLDGYSKSLVDRPLYRPCGSCYACQCNTRAEWAYRAAAELKALEGKGMSIFLTLTYRDDCVPTIFDFLFPDQVLDPCMASLRRFWLGREKSKPFFSRNYSFTLLVREHLSKFIEKCNADYKKMRFGLWYTYETREYYDKSKGKVRKRRYLVPTELYKKEYRFHNLRVFASGEYGSFTSRCHYHVLMFVPMSFTRNEFQSMIEKNWMFGHIDFDFDFGKAAINYVAKHQVKDDCGTKFQREWSPIFKYVSVYQGGIGVSGVNHDNYSRYTSIDLDGNFDSRYFDVADERYGVIYRIAMPRYYKDKFWKMYCDFLGREYERTEADLEIVSRKSYENFFNYLVENDFYTKFVDENFCKKQSEIPPFEWYVMQKGFEFTEKKRREYLHSKIAQKKFKIVKQLNFKLQRTSMSVID